MSLSDLGVSGDDERVYRVLLRDPDAGVERVAAELGLAPDEVAAGVGRLSALGLVTGSDDRIVATNPQNAVEDLIARRIAEVNEELRRISAARSVVRSLDSERLSPAPVELVERIDGTERTNERISQIAQNARECLAVQMARRTVGSGREEVFRRIRSGVAYRTIVHRSLLEIPELDTYFRELHRAGDRHRVIDELVQHLVIFDRSVAFVPIDPADTGRGALMVGQPGMVATLVALFEQTWARGTDLEPVEHAELSATERRVLDLLIRVDKDETAAREMGVSVRTFRRHVAALMARLGATNRFHAAYLARDRGWI